jgi:hypothetical protein
MDSAIPTQCRRFIVSTDIGARLFLGPRTVEWHIGRLRDADRDA